MGKNRTIGGLDREGISKLHPDVEKILVRAAHGLDDETEHVIVEQLRKAMVRALNRAADHADGINAAQHLRNAALLFDGKSIYDRTTRAAHDADFSAAIETLRKELDERNEPVLVVKDMTSFLRRISVYDLIVALSVLRDSSRVRRAK